MQLSPAFHPHLQPSVAGLGPPWIERRARGTVLEMTAQAAASESGDAALAADEQRLARAAAGGDGDAFATLYERYERRAYNLAYRLTTSEEDAADAVQDAFVSVMRRLPKLADRELAFGSYLFTATRNASYDLLQRRKRAQPSDAIPEAAVPVGAAAGGGLGLDPGDPGDDPDRKLLLESQQDEVRAANERLPERQREVLALRELEELSYDEIAEIMDMNRNSVAQLISRARIKLRDELRGEALASIAASSPDCERALPLIAMRDDGQLDAAGEDAAWLDGHLGGCHTCRLGVEAMQEAGVSYRAWAPIAAAPWLFDEALARAAEATGADWSATIAERSAKHDPAALQPGMPPLYRAFATPAAAARRRRRGIVAAAALGVAALLAIVATVLGQDDPPNPAEPAAKQVETVAEPAPADEPTKRKPARAKGRARKDASKDATSPSAGAGAAGQAPSSDPDTTAGDRGEAPARRRPRTGAQRPDRGSRQPDAPATPAPPPATQPQPEPAPDPPPTADEPPPVEPSEPTEPTEPPPPNDPGPIL